jgi:predicted nucleic acid-binding protein
MGEQYLIDSNVVIYYLGGKLPAAGNSFMNDVIGGSEVLEQEDEIGNSFMDNVIDAIPNVSVITKIEVLGFNAPPQDYQLLIEFFEDAIIFELIPEIVEQAIELRKAYKIKLGDSIIAATALVYDLSLITRNINDFKSIAGLQLVNPHEM